ncbi:hypothetical protein Tco_0145156 [Tanacetum coccineum]
MRKPMKVPVDTTLADSIGIVAPLQASSYARTMIELRADVELKDTIVVAMRKLIREGFYTCTVHVEYEWKPPRNKKNDAEPTKNVSNSNPFDVLNSVENDVDLGTNGRTSNLFEKQIIDGKVTLVDDEGEPVKKVNYPVDHDSEDEVASVDNYMARSMASEKVGFGTNSLLEQWRDTYENDDYDYDPYDDNMYEGQ